GLGSLAQHFGIADGAHWLSPTQSKAMNAPPIFATASTGTESDPIDIASDFSSPLGEASQDQPAPAATRPIQQGPYLTVLSPCPHGKRSHGAKGNEDREDRRSVDVSRTPTSAARIAPKRYAV